jgi:hypothetical protein
LTFNDYYIARDRNGLPRPAGTAGKMTTTEAVAALAVTVAAAVATWYAVARLLPRVDRLSRGAVTWLSALVLFVGFLVALAGLVFAVVVVGWLRGLGRVDLLTWFFLAMAVALLDAVWIARARAVPVLTETDGVDVSAVVLSAVRTGTAFGGVLSALGFLGLAVTELTTQPGRVGDLARTIPQNPIVLLGFLVGAPIFCLAYGALLALYLRVTVIKPE